MLGRRITGMVIVGVIAATNIVQAQDHVAPKVAKTSVLPLPAKHRAALVAEMRGVKAGIAELSGSIAMGEWKATAQQAERIRDSYIMKQKLTSRELAELEHALSADFIDKDSEFHRHADGLAHAALAHNYELETFYFSKILEGCGACHTRYATDVFKGFKLANHTQASH